MHLQLALLEIYYFMGLEGIGVYEEMEGKEVNGKRSSADAMSRVTPPPRPPATSGRTHAVNARGVDGSHCFLCIANFAAPRRARPHVRADVAGDRLVALPRQLVGVGGRRVPRREVGLGGLADLLEREHPAVHPRRERLPRARRALEREARGELRQRRQARRLGGHGEEEDEDDEEY